MASEHSRSEIQKTYIAYYGRPADEGGLEYWANLLDEAGGDLSVIIDAFANSPEFLESFGDLEESELINNIYQQLFGEDADPEGLDFYVRLIQQGEKTLGSVALDILNGAKNEHADIIDNKFEYAQRVTLTIKVKNKHYDGDSAISLKLKIKGIGASDESLDEALAALDDEINEFDDFPGSSGDPGQGSDNRLYHIELEDGVQEVIAEQYGSKLKVKNFGSDDLLILPGALLNSEEDATNEDDDSEEEPEITLTLEEAIVAAAEALVEAEIALEEAQQLLTEAESALAALTPESTGEENTAAETAVDEAENLVDEVGDALEDAEELVEELQEPEEEDEEAKADLVLGSDAVDEDWAEFFAADNNNKITFSWESDNDSDEEDDGIEEGDVVDDSEEIPEVESEGEAPDYHLNVKVHYDGGFVQLHHFVISDDDAFDFSLFDSIEGFVVTAQDDILIVDFDDDNDESTDYSEYEEDALELLELVGIQFGELTPVEPIL